VIISLKDRKLFIKNILVDVAEYLSAKNHHKAVYTYKKGYLADADILAHKFISSAIQKDFPDDLVYSEEDVNSFSNEIQKDSFLWMIDPICGSANYIKRFPFYVHALSVFDIDGVLYSGVYHPDCNDLFLADRKGTTLNGRNVNVSGVQKLDEALVAINCNQADWERENNNLSNIVNLFSPPITRRLHILESANLEMAYVACGRLDAYINPDDKVWDIAAGSLMISSAGGQTHLLNGKLFPLSQENIGVIAANNYLMSAIKNVFNGD
tara:strand:+ start:19 stop:819 length:801 start_codon:yes stop_codon:yes gene_type:complete